MKKPLLDIRNLHVALPEGSQRPYAVQDASMRLERNQILCVVGESGSGKSLTARAVMGLLPRPHVRIAEGDIDFRGENLATVSDARMREVRGSEISMIFQE
ncbi:MAG: ATP-binding cassette domain-containing protein, partial [Pseudomonadota bacterium]